MFSSYLSIFYLSEIFNAIAFVSVTMRALTCRTSEAWPFLFYEPNRQSIQDAFVLT